MEEAASVAAPRFFTWLIMAFSQVAWFVGFFTTYKGIRGFRSPHLPRLFVPDYDPRAFERWEGSFLERVAVGLGGAVGVVLVLGLAAAIGWTRPQPRDLIGFLLMMAVCLPLVAPVVLWNTRYRAAGEGIATMAIATISIFAQLSAGYGSMLGSVLVPVVALLVWLCIAQLRRANHPWETMGPRVDSSP